VIVQGQLVNNSNNKNSYNAAASSYVHSTTPDFSQALDSDYIPPPQNNPNYNNNNNYGNSNYTNSHTPSVMGVMGYEQPMQPPPPPMDTTGRPQSSSNCRDFVWMLLFYAHLAGIAACTAIYVPQAINILGVESSNGAQRRLSFSSSSFRQLEDDGGQDFPLDMNVILQILVWAGLAACVLSSLAMLFMMKFAEGLIKMALIWNVGMAGIMVLLAIVAGVPGMAILFVIAAAFSLYWTCVVWAKIPFAAANLVTATTAVRANMGLAFYCYLNLILTFLWTFWWSIAFLATGFIMGDCSADGNCEGDMNPGIFFLFLVSFYWTAQVLKNVTHTTVAGTVGTFWFIPHEANGCCSKAVRDSYFRSMTTSFGSICLGSLIVAIIQAAKEVVNSMREQEDSILLCLVECLMGWLESLAEYFNQWAFVYVGLYGYGFVEAGQNVIALFKARGWTSIVADMLVDTVLTMVSSGVGILTGLVGVLIGEIIGGSGTTNETLIVAFLVGMAIGFILCSTLFSLISSAVNATIVLYAEAPNELERHHPQLSQQMRLAWRKAYPNEFQY